MEQKECTDKRENIFRAASYKSNTGSQKMRWKDMPDSQVSFKKQNKIMEILQEKTNKTKIKTVKQYLEYFRASEDKNKIIKR